MPRVFLCYRRDDAAGHAGRLYDRLSEHFGSAHIFRDMETIEPGLDFAAFIEKAARSSDAMLAVIGRRWLSVADARGQRRLDDPRDWVRVEIATALKRRIRVIPVLVDRATTMPGAEDLPRDIARLARLQALLLTDEGWRQDVERLLQILEKIGFSRLPTDEVRQAAPVISPIQEPVGPLSSTTLRTPRLVHQRAPEIRTVRGREYCLVPAGRFWMGTQEARVEQLRQEVDAWIATYPFANEVNLHPVDVAAFYVGRFPVTNREYKEFVDATGCAVPFRDDAWSRPMNWDERSRTYPAGRDEHPVTLVSWHDANAYCRWLGTRLCTEAEWEKAARGDDQREWPWGNTWQAGRCNAGSDGLQDITPVDHYRSRGESPYGVRDMVGNVWEWCSSINDTYPYDPTDGREEQGVSVAKRVQRGGAYMHPAQLVRCATRGAADAHDFGHNVGFRVVLIENP